jgi:hypothetical protein
MRSWQFCVIAPRLRGLSELSKILLRYEHALLRKFGHFLFQFVQRSRGLDVIFLFAEVIAESFDVDPKLVRDHFTRPSVVIFGVMSLPRIGSAVGQCFNDPKFLRDNSPILVESLKFTDEIGEHNSVMIDKPIELVPIRRRMDTRGAAVLNPIDKLLERHFVSELPHFLALIKRNDAVPRVANEPELEVGLELLTTGVASVLLWQCEIKNFQYSVRSPTDMRPITLHVIFDLPQIQVRLPWPAQDGPDTGRASLGHLNENAFVFVRDHGQPRLIVY